MKCHECKRTLKFMKGIPFNEHRIDGWKCACGEIVFDGAQAERVLILNKLKKRAIRAKLGKIRSNLILRLPKDVEAALSLRKGEEVLLKVEGGTLTVRSAEG